MTNYDKAWSCLVFRNNDEVDCQATVERIEALLNQYNKPVCKHSHTVRNPIQGYHQCQDCYAIRWDEETKWWPTET